MIAMMMMIMMKMMVVMMMMMMMISITTQESVEYRCNPSNIIYVVVLGSKGSSLYPSIMLCLPEPRELYVWYLIDLSSYLIQNKHSFSDLVLVTTPFRHTHYRGAYYVHNMVSVPTMINVTFTILSYPTIRTRHWT